jgi:hypothetical protein
MLCVNKYKKDYIDECRARMESQYAPHKTLATAARVEKQALNSAVDAFEPLFFNNLTLVLDNYFVHRSRTMEGKDGNPLDEFRMICTLLLQNHGVMCTDKTNNKTIKYNPEKSVLKLQVEAPIKLSESDFLRLFRAFFEEIESKFGERKGWAGRQGAGANNP